MGTVGKLQMWCTFVANIPQLDHHCKICLVVSTTRRFLGIVYHASISITTDYCRHSGGNAVQQQFNELADALTSIGFAVSIS